METRDCACCGEAKPISGVWYVLADDSGAFMCGVCYAEESGPTVAPVGA